MNSKNTFFSTKTILNCKGKLIDISSPIVMGILNITPDSFYDGGRFIAENEILLRTEQIINEGAKILDIGAYSSRPDATHISEEEELSRLRPILSLIKKKIPETIISVDTFRSNIAKTVVNEFDVDIINDISAGNMDDKMFETIADLQVPYIIMHMKGVPQTMHLNPAYTDIIQEIIKYFAEKIQKLKLLGINDIIIDPGFGFGKNIDQNTRAKLLNLINQHGSLRDIDDSSKTRTVYVFEIKKNNLKKIISKAATKR